MRTNNLISALCFMVNPIKTYKKRTGLTFEQIAALTHISIPQLYRLIGSEPKWGEWEEVRLRTIKNFFDISEGQVDLLAYATEGKFKINSK